VAARGAVAQFQDQADKRGVTVKVEPPGDDTIALADPDRIHQVLVNLLSNAIRFTPVGGTVTISFGRTDSQVSCAIVDTGPGIPAQDIPQVFERFYRGDRSRTRPEGESGAGLGLAIVRAIVEAHGGQAWAENAPGRGTAVTFTLPPVV
jgi:signal transduction histidine kinase